MKWALMLALPLALSAETPADSARRKLDRFSDGSLKPGDVIVFTPVEINAWAREKVPMVIPQGLREPHVDLGTDTANGTALVDFLKIREGLKLTTNSLFAALLQGERPLKISVRVVSGGGKGIVYLTRVEFGGVVAEGAILDFLIKNVFAPLFPGAKVDQQFEFDFHIDRLDIRPDGVRVTIGR